MLINQTNSVLEVQSSALGRNACRSIGALQW